jgi:hypothetical protein
MKLVLKKGAGNITNVAEFTKKILALSNKTLNMVNAKQD